MPKNATTTLRIEGELKADFEQIFRHQEKACPLLTRYRDCSDGAAHRPCHRQQRLQLRATEKSSQRCLHECTDKGKEENGAGSLGIVLSGRQVLFYPTGKYTG
jgi:hypothetical protein